MKCDCSKCPFYRPCNDRIEMHEDVKEYLVSYCPLEQIVEKMIDVKATRSRRTKL